MQHPFADYPVQFITELDCSPEAVRFGIMPIDPAQAALSVVNHIPAIVAYWDTNQLCVFSNNAYREWFGREPAEMVGMSIKELLGPLYEKNLPHILGALRGEKQLFERQLILPGGGVREGIVTYTPDVVDGEVRGFSVHVADVTTLRAREAALEKVNREREAVLAELRTFRGLLPICAGCKSIRDAQGEWHSIEQYVSTHTDAKLTHGMCPKCTPKYFPGVYLADGI